MKPIEVIKALGDIIDDEDISDKEYNTIEGIKVRKFYMEDQGTVSYVFHNKEDGEFILKLMFKTKKIGHLIEVPVGTIEVVTPEKLDQLKADIEEGCKIR